MHRDKGGHATAAAVIVLQQWLHTPVFFFLPRPFNKQTAASDSASVPHKSVESVLRFSFFFFFPKAWLLCRRGLSCCLQVIHHLPRWHPDLHQVLPSHGRGRALGQPQTLLHPHHQQVPGSQSLKNDQNDHIYTAVIVSWLAWGETDRSNRLKSKKGSSPGFGKVGFVNIHYENIRHKFVPWFELRQQIESSLFEERIRINFQSVIYYLQQTIESLFLQKEPQHLWTNWDALINIVQILCFYDQETRRSI